MDIPRRFSASSTRACAAIAVAIGLVAALGVGCAPKQRIPLDCVVVRNDISRGVAMQLRDALLTLHHDGTVSTALRDSWGMNGFVEPKHEAYKTIEAIAQAEEASCK